ncbi:hypothetical protein EV179_001541 [Coemansia sp. RSA 487]|nr:hypothetical protein LPJ74_003087 [Coemansia sp. RSA 1843]KAJ2216302.1 hypothetical protein EV179_001541 [Coemansia sp. RSA 487]
MPAAGNKGLSTQPLPINPATMVASAQQAYASSLYPGRSLSPQDIRLIVEQESYKVQHQGHEGKHALMFLIFVCVLATLPRTVTYWRQRYPMSYRLVSIGSICLIPVYFAAANHYNRFVCIWLVYALANTYVLYMATRSPLHARTPRRVYRWYAFINKASYAVFVAGGLLFLLGFFNIMPGLTDTEYYIETSMLTVFYGLYFGLMSRDLVTLCTDRMATTLGYSSRGTRLPTKFLPKHVCCICGDRLGGRFSRGKEAADAGGMLAAASTSGRSAGHGSAVEDAVIAEPTHALGCGHEFHASCIRGWCVIGKKDVCPFCSEKVDLQEFKRNPWDKQELFYVTALEYMRFFVLVSDNSWHKTCLTCNQCNKRLDMRTLMEHRNEIYCNKCHTDINRAGPSRAADGYISESAQTSPINAHPSVQYAPPPSERGLNPADTSVLPPQMAHKLHGGDTAAGSDDVTASYRSTTTTNYTRTNTTTTTTTPSYKSESPHRLSLNTTGVDVAPYTPPRQGYLGNSSVSGYKRAGEISPSSVFSSGRAKLNLPATKDTCRRCSKTIFHAEKVVGPGGLWHRACFRCKSCSRALTPAILTDHEGEAFCNNCHNKLFAPRGYNIGGSTEPLQQYSRSPSGSVESFDRYSPSRRRSGAIPAAEYEARSPPYYGSSPNRRESHYGDQSPYGSAAAAAAAAAVTGQSNRSPTSLAMAADARPSSARSSSRMAYGRPYKPARQFGLGGPPPDTCHHCQKTIYAMELAYAAGNKYHRACLKCKDCNTRVDSLKMTEHDGEIYCKGCYAKQFGPNGFRNTLSTSINNF